MPSTAQRVTVTQLFYFLFVDFSLVMTSIVIIFGFHLCAEMNFLRFLLNTRYYLKTGKIKISWGQKIEADFIKSWR